MVQETTFALLGDMVAALGLEPDTMRQVAFTRDEQLPSCFPVTPLAGSTIAAASLAVAELLGELRATPSVAVDLRLASHWFGFSIKPLGWTIPAPWDDLAGDYLAGDGWIKLHTNAPHHKAAVLAVLGCEASRSAVEAAVARWDSDQLEQAIVDAGGCSAKLRSRSEWISHPQGQAIAREPLVLVGPARPNVPSSWTPSPGRPLDGLRVLDLTRVLAGPVATRFLAGFGAQVLRLDPPDWDEPGVIPEVTLGKRCARLDLHSADGRRIFECLLGQADVLIHGYRANALERLGYGEQERQDIRPGLIDVSLNAYGYSGPWRTRRGFDSLVQFSSGIATEGMSWKFPDAASAFPQRSQEHGQSCIAAFDAVLDKHVSAKPVSLPVQALDHGTGYLVAAAAIRGLICRLRWEPAQSYSLSLARTAELLFAHRSGATDDLLPPAEDSDFAPDHEATSWGPAQRLRPASLIEGNAMAWGSPAVRLGSSEPAWFG